jgi:hypothetical protein
MKKRFIYLLILMSFPSYTFCLDKDEEKFIEITRKNPSISLNPQDLPIFFEEDNPLTGMHTFNLIPPLSLKNTDTQKSVQKVIEKELEQIGEIIHLKEMDTRGMGSGNILNIQIGNVLGWDNNELPVSRVSLQVQTFVVINRTGIKTFPVVWSINTFFPNSSEPNSEEVMLKATQKLVRDFVQNYKYANQKKKEKLIFYTYY